MKQKVTGPELILLAQVCRSGDLSSAEPSALVTPVTANSAGPSLFPDQWTSNGDILVDLIPMDPNAGTNQAPVGALLVRGIAKTRNYSSIRGGAATPLDSTRPIRGVGALACEGETKPTQSSCRGTIGRRKARTPLKDGRARKESIAQRKMPTR